MFRSSGWTLAAIAALGACSDPDQFTDLRPDGAPEVLTVLVMNDAAGGYLETATYCKVDDAKRPSEVGLIDLSLTQVCPADLTEGVPMVEDAVPTGWYVRVVFDELLDPNIEELSEDIDSTSGDPTGTFTGHIANTKPVVLKCGGHEVPYDGYYSPSGNHVTWPVGPSLVIVPDDPTAVPSGTECTVEIKDTVHDKQGETVPADQRGTSGQYKFKIATIAMVATDPAGIAEPGPDNRSLSVPEAPVTFTFNTVLDPSSLTNAKITMFKGITADDCTGGTQVATADVVVFQMLDDSPPDGVVADPTSVQIMDASAANANPAPNDPNETGQMFDEMETYRIEIVPASTVRDVAGGEGDLSYPTDEDDNPIVLCFDTDAAS